MENRSKYFRVLGVLGALIGMYLGFNGPFPWPPGTGGRVPVWQAKTSYDVVVKIPTLTAIDQEGWEVLQLSNRSTLRGRVWKKIGFTGFYNSGKTFLLSQLIGKALMQGLGAGGKTEGVSLLFDEDKGAIFYDVAGYQRSTPQSDVVPSHLVDVFISDWVRSEVDILLIVVSNELRKGEQLLIRKAIHDTAKSDVELVIVHNYRDFSSLSDVKDNIENDIVQAYDAVIQPGCAERAWQHTYRGPAGLTKTVRHFVLARDGSEAGKHFNDLTLQRLATLVQATNAKHDISTVEACLAGIAQSMSVLLPEFFYDRPLRTLSDVITGTTAHNGLGISAVPAGKWNGVVDGVKTVFTSVLSNVFALFGSADSAVAPPTQADGDATPPPPIAKPCIVGLEVVANTEEYPRCVNAWGGEFKLCQTSSLRLNKESELWPEGCKLVYLPIDPISLEHTVRVTLSGDVVKSPGSRHAYLLLELPGVRADDIYFRYRDNVVSVHGTKRPPAIYNLEQPLHLTGSIVDTKQLEAAGLMQNDRRFGQFLYRIPCPPGTDITNWGSLQETAMSYPDVLKTKLKENFLFQDGVLQVTFKLNIK